MDSQNFKIIVNAQVDPANIRAQLKQIEKTLNLKIGTATTKSASTTSAKTTSDTAKDVSKVNAAYKDTEKTIKASSKAQMGFTAKIKEAMVASTTWAIAMGVLYGTLRKISEGMKFAYDFENQMNRIQMVSGATTQELDGLAKSYTNLATKLSSTTSAVAESAEEWIRQGRSVADTAQLIEVSQVMAKIAALDNVEAAKLLTSAINGYALSASEAISVVDKMSAIDVAAATGTDDLANAMARTASSAKIAGVNMDELLSYVATVSDVTRKSAESIGNSFKTMFARIQQVKIGSLLDEEGEDISNVDRVLKSYGISLRNAEGQFRDTGTVLKELAVLWKGLESTQKSELGTTIAGVRQRENFLKNRALT